MEVVGEVVGVHVSSKHTFSKGPVDRIRLIENFGVEGDAHAGATDQHQYHIKRFGARPNLRQVHVIHAELFDELDEKGHVVRPGDLGENIATRGVDLLALPTGTRLHFGSDAVIELTGLRNPCVQVEDFQPGLLKHVAVSKPTGLERKAGVMSVVISGGIVKPGDAVYVELPPQPHEPLMYRPPVLELQIEAIRREAEGVHSVELTAPDGSDLPPFSAGAHVDLLLAPELTRSYSLTNDPAERHRYVVAVNKDPDSRGGSVHVHEQLRVGDRLQVSPPRNNFPLDESAEHTVLIAGGIGITPLRAMIARLERLDRPWELYYAARNRKSVAFWADLELLEAKRPGRIHINLSDSSGGRLDIEEVVGSAPDGAHFYCCGPERMVEAFRAAAAQRPAASVHAELFHGAGAPATEGGFRVTLQRSDTSLAVKRGQTVLDALLAAGIEVPFSCKEGVCGSCRVKVIRGLPDHRDLVMTPEEQAKNDQMYVCCSGAKTPELVLDL
ncbi:2Fe-2S iron-sulfur cluster-binding protein [uncultured Leifsonia sp.]|uniref:2Fe-2S iron-sulfur cluster-binding protein n=1 Tax=uncultured Leifsonia sp. TaxID=340359 RepID=UPI0028D471AA|nr:2Fe-2S iron-sulfur cluster-binding protein [uncultured Leifsonia sp.]